MVTARALRRAPDDSLDMRGSTISSSGPPAGHSFDAGHPVVASRRGHARPNAWLAAVGIWAALGLVSLAPRSLADDAGLADPGSRLLYHLVHILTLGALTGAVVWIARRTETWRPRSRL